MIYLQEEPGGEMEENRAVFALWLIFQILSSIVCFLAIGLPALILSVPAWPWVWWQTRKEGGLRKFFAVPS